MYSSSIFLRSSAARRRSCISRIAVAWILRQREALHQVLARGLHVRRLADGLDDRIEVVQGDLEPLKDVGPVACLLEVELGAPPDDLPAPLDVVLEDRLERQGLRLPVDERHDVGAEGELERRVLEQVVEHLARRGVLLALDDHAHPVAAGLVLEPGDAVDLAALDQVGDLLHERRLVDLVRQLRGHDRGAALARLLERDRRLHHDPPPSMGVHVADGVDLLPHPRERVAASVVAEDRGAGGEVRPQDDVRELVGRQLRVVDERVRGARHLAEVVRRDVGGHADRDPR